MRLGLAMTMMMLVATQSKGVTAQRVTGAIVAAAVPSLLMVVIPTII
jgi:hypothetical protein